ncbi:type VI secretion system protein ImpM [Niveibacterium umoris]|uniref:Type VI secretion system protein ImpM n=2 Tax=Niveibacterium umoris TaxID=1193620 RepID=A0A840BDR6_9RHOO|nr:type VI secretion system protein ImpM [Niveibacterium umoris]
MAESQRALGPAWLDRYLTAPVWRFVLTPGVLGSQGWAGVLLPSVDRVGRYFPLTVCAPLDGVLLERATLDLLSSWLDRAEAAARACLAHDATVDGFEASLAAIGLPALFPAMPSQAANALLQRASPVELDRTASGPDLGTLADGVLAQVLRGYTLWWQAGGRAFLHQHLPAAARYTSMIDQTFGA